MNRLYRLYTRYVEWCFRKVCPDIIKKLERYEHLERIAHVQLIVVTNTIHSTGTKTFRKSQHHLMKISLEELVLLHTVAADPITGISSMFAVNNAGMGMTISSDNPGTFLDIMVVG